jgi:hypothetical protein
MDSLDSEQGMLVDNEQERMESKQERLDCAGQWTLGGGGWKVSTRCPRCCTPKSLKVVGNEIEGDRESGY